VKLIQVVTLISWFLLSCTQETQNKISRSIQNWTGTNGVVDVISDGKVLYRWIQVDKLSTALSSGSGSKDARAYRYGYGFMDLNQNFIVDPNEKKVYFEVSDYATYVFYESPFPSE
jgi:hypothetical protein